MIHLISANMRALFVRIGCHRSYAGPQDEHDWPKGAGKTPVNLHGEAFNFFDFGETWYGNFGVPYAPQARRRGYLNLRRIDPKLSTSETSIKDVLVIFVATLLGDTNDAITRRCEGSGQRIVGWYRTATVHDGSDLPEYPPGVKSQIDNHFSAHQIENRHPEMFTSYKLRASKSNCEILEPPEREDFFKIPHEGPGCFGQYNVCYLYEKDYVLKKHSPWIRKAIKKITDR
jgi:hypothetical protein